MPRHSKFHVRQSAGRCGDGLRFHATLSWATACPISQSGPFTLDSRCGDLLGIAAMGEKRKWLDGFTLLMLA